MIEDNQKTDKMICNIDFNFFDIADIRGMTNRSDNDYLIGMSVIKILIDIK